MAEGPPGPPAPRTMELVDWWLSAAMYRILPNRLYWLLGANVSDSEGEAEWYDLLDTLGLIAPHWSQEHERLATGEAS